jgi:thymidylate synthase ThyX
MTEVEPLVIKLAETQLDEKGVQEFAKHYGATEWLNRARLAQPNSAEFLIELSGRSCYKSFGIGLNPNVTKIREDSRDYLTNVLQKGDGSILEHATVTFAFLNVSRVTTHEIVRHRAGTAMCLPGDTLIASVRNLSGKPNGTRKRRLDYLFNLTKTPHGRSRVKLLRLRVLNERDYRFTKGLVSRIVYSGEKPVFEVELADGSKCKMTKDHTLYTSTGWLRLEDLVQFIHVSDSGTAFYGKPVAKVAVNGYVVPNTAVTLKDGSLAYRNKEWLEQNIRNGSTYNEIGRAAGVSRHTVRAWSGKLGLNGLSKSLKLYARAGNRGMHYKLNYTRTDLERRAIALRMKGSRNHRWRGGITPHPMLPQIRRSILERDYYRCRMCNRVPPRRSLHIHHIDPFQQGKASNEDPNNLITLCVTCHGKVTGFEARYAPQLYSLLDVQRDVGGSTTKPRRVLKPKLLEVKSIRYCGIQRTYDIFMEPPHHNYVANGFIVHNSQESLRYVRPREIALWTPPDLEPVLEKFKDAVEEIKRRYRDLETSFNWDEMTFEQKKRVTSALRRILPDGIATNLIWTANHRTIRWVIEMRTHPSAEVEIRKVFGKVAEICIGDYPLLYGDFKSKKLDDGTTQYIPKFSKV